MLIGQKRQPRLQLDQQTTAPKELEQVVNLRDVDLNQNGVKDDTIDLNGDGVADEILLQGKYVKTLTYDKLLYGWSDIVISADVDGDGTDDNQEPVVRGPVEQQSAQLQAKIDSEAKRANEVLDVLEGYCDILGKDGKLHTGVLLEALMTKRLPNGEPTPPELIDAARYLFANPRLGYNLDRASNRTSNPESWADQLISKEDFEIAREWLDDGDIVLELGLTELQVDPLSEADFADAVDVLALVLKPTFDDNQRGNGGYGNEHKVVFDYDQIALAVLSYDLDEEQQKLLFGLLESPFAFRKLEIAADRDRTPDGLVSWADILRFAPQWKYENVPG